MRKLPANSHSSGPTATAPVVDSTPPALMAAFDPEIADRRAVRSQFVGDQPIGNEAFFFRACASVSRLQPCRAVVAPGDREPRLHRRPRARARTAGPQSSWPSRRDATAPLAVGVDGEFASEQRPEFQDPSPHCFVGDIQSTLSEQIFDVAITERETNIEPNRVSDDRRGELVAGKRDRHAPSYPPTRDALPLP